MANHTQIYRRNNNPITVEETAQALEEISQECFNGHLTIEVVGDYIMVCKSLGKDTWEKFELWIQDSPYVFYRNDEETTYEGSYVDIRHGHRSQVYRWLDNFLLSRLANKLDAYCYGEAHIDINGEMMEKPYQEYNRPFQEHAEGMFINKSIWNYFLRKGLKKNNIKWAKKCLSEEMFNQIMTM